MPTVTIYLSEKERAFLKQDATALNISVSALVRQRLLEAEEAANLRERVEALERWREEVSGG